MTFKMHTEHATTIDGTEYKTRAWYMAPESVGEEQRSRHREFYAQFVTPAVRRIVRQTFKRSWPQLVAAFQSGDTSLNTCTALDQWDRLSPTIHPLVGSAVTKATYAEFTPNRYFWSLSENICICKEAARQVIEEDAAALEGANHASQ